jgi:hypothetical protein
MAQVNIDQAALRRMLRSPDGMVGLETKRRADLVAAEARRQARGSMKDQIPAPHVVSRTPGPAADVISMHFATVWVVKGTRPHVIRPRPPKKALRFTTGGRIVFAKRVNHPGNAARDFLNAALRQAL